MRFKDSGLPRDAGGLIEKAFHFLEISCLQNGLKVGESLELMGARILSGVPHIEPDVIAAHLAAGTMLHVPHAAASESLSPRVADMLERMREILSADPSRYREAIAASDEGVRLSYLARGIATLENSLARYGDKPLHEKAVATVVHEGKVAYIVDTVGEILRTEYRNAVNLTAHIIVETGARQLNERFDEALYQTGLKLGPQKAGPAFAAHSPRPPRPGGNLPN